MDGWYWSWQPPRPPNGPDHVASKYQLRKDGPRESVGKSISQLESEEISFENVVSFCDAPNALEEKALHYHLEWKFDQFKIKQCELAKRNCVQNALLHTISRKELIYAKIKSPVRGHCKVENARTEDRSKCVVGMKTNVGYLEQANMRSMKLALNVITVGTFQY